MGWTTHSAKHVIVPQTSLKMFIKYHEGHFPESKFSSVSNNGLTLKASGISSEVVFVNRLETVSGVVSGVDSKWDETSVSIAPSSGGERSPDETVAVLFGAIGTSGGFDEFELDWEFSDVLGVSS